VRRLDRLRGLTVIGVGCGLAGFAIAFGLETVTVRAFGEVATLWLTGPIEEGGKLLVPFLLLAFGSARFKDPLVGLYLVLVSGATTGAVEGTSGRPAPITTGTTSSWRWSGPPPSSPTCSSPGSPAPSSGWPPGAATGPSPAPGRSPS